MLQPSRGKTFNQGSLNSNYVFRLLKVLLRSEWRQINPLFKESNNFAYRKIPKISPGAYIFQRPFLGGLFLEGPIFGGAYLRREICVSNSIGLALWLEVNLPFLLCFTLYLRAVFQVQAPRGLYLEGRIKGGFLRYRFGGLC